MDQSQLLLLSKELKRTRRMVLISKARRLYCRHAKYIKASRGPSWLSPFLPISIATILNQITGYVVFSASSDGTEIKSAVMRSLYLRPRVEKGIVVYGRSDANTCRRFLRCGAEESDAFSRKINEAIGEVDSLLRRGPVIVLSLEGHSTWGTRLAHPSRNASHFQAIPPDLSREATRETRPVVRKLRPNEILFVKGSVRMGIEAPTGGSFVWLGNSGDPMASDMLGPEVFEFMAI
ncbi:hypothetical protein N7499_003040 [Penicillium canescens]|nr:hypothetical protein N7499_003040 [Penicillium canescens]